MLFHLAADLVLVAHLAFIMFVLFGGLLTLRWPTVALLHLPTVAYGAMIEFVGWTCPLTPLENDLRQAAGDAGYTGGFVEHYLLPLIYPAGLTDTAQLVLGIAVLAVNAVVYGVVWWRQRTASGPQAR